MLKFIGAGLSRTGTLSLSNALEILGFKSIHFDTKRLNDILDGSVQQPSFRRYDDVDAVVDLPAAYFYQELMEAYPGSKVILTIREIEAWWRSVDSHLNKYGVTEEKRIKHRLGERFGFRPWKELSYDSFRRTLRKQAFGSATPREFLYKKKYRQHNDLVLATVPPERLLVLNIAAGEGWEKLCPFVGVAVPDTPFPHAHGVTSAHAPPLKQHA